MDIRFDGKRALVTGAGKGIGYGIAKALAAGGAETFALSRTQADLDRLKAENPDIHTVCVDLADWAATKKAVEKLGSIHLLVNNAAVVNVTRFLEIEEAEIKNIFEINVHAVVNVSQVVSKGMIARGKGGSIVNISSIAGRIAIGNVPVYTASKGALEMLTKAMTEELGPHQIRVNNVNPTIVMTEMAKIVWSDPAKSGPLLKRTPQGKFAEVKDVVHAVMFLLSDKSVMINGVSLYVDGGVTAV
ncbi:hypothetical protein NP493_775g01113 [Ridgeia piscesae]|uniref:L-xylulose reductase n=1 Tax=Ridgeia piscesae TaxID=27915 RepID=A0AAD9KPA0_RIDPI|nr:hypothetical protein NP493_775g01113 [Ridgeia piscesae]